MRVPLLLSAGLTVSALLTGCTPTLIVEEPADAANPDCATVMLRMPEEIDGVTDRTTSAQSTEAWGDPAMAIARCGVEVPGPTTDECVSVDGVDWISRPGDDYWQFVTYGREPAVEVLVSRERVGGETVLAAISQAVAVIEPTAKCLDRSDVAGGD